MANLIKNKNKNTHTPKATEVIKELHVFPRFILGAVKVGEISWTRSGLSDVASFSQLPHQRPKHMI